MRADHNEAREREQPEVHGDQHPGQVTYCRTLRWSGHAMCCAVLCRGVFLLRSSGVFHACFVCVCFCVFVVVRVCYAGSVGGSVLAARDFECDYLPP